MKYSGLSLSGAYYYDDAQKSAGFHSQLGYVLSKRVQPVLRYARVNPDGEDNDIQEIAGGISLYLYGHKLKWQTEVAMELEDESGSDSETKYQVRSQLQLSF